MIRRVSALATLWAALAWCATAAEPLRYTIRISEPHKNYADVEVSIPSDAGANPELKMAVWTPYVVREFAAHVERVKARDASGPVAVTKSAKNRWRVQAEGPATFTYRVYAHKMHVQDNWIDSEFALLNPGAVLVTLAGKATREHIVRVEAPAAWKRVLSQMRTTETPNEFVARDYDTLVDSPILAGNPMTHEFMAGGKPHMLVTFGDTRQFDGANAARAVKSIVDEQLKFWGGAPYDRYYFFNLLTGTTGHAMEHAGSTVLMTDPLVTTQSRTMQRWLALVSHEFFHVWNVKRLSPAEITPGEFEVEPLIPSLGIAEGFTNYYSVVFLSRADLATPRGVLGSMSEFIERVQRTPGRLVQSLVQSSLDTFIKFYRPDEDSRNTSVSYYDKGAIVAMLLDVRVRALTNGQRSLDDVMRGALEAHPDGYTLAQFQSVAERVAGASLANFFRDNFNGTGELNFTEFLDWNGLTFDDDPDGGSVLFGAEMLERDGKLMVSTVLRGTPAYEAGLNVGDELVSINDIRADRDSLKRYRPGDRVFVAVARRGRMLRLEVALGRTPAIGWRLTAADRATPQQKARVQEWLRAKPR